MNLQTCLWQELRQEYEKLQTGLDANPSACRLYRGKASKALYVQFLIRSYHYVRHTRSFLARAARLMIHRGQNLELARLLARKASEETGHEIWILNDLKALGISKRAVQRTHPSRAVAAYVSWIRLAIEVTPASILAVAFILEHLSCRAGEAARSLIEHSGIPGIAGAVSFLVGHAEADEDHVKHLVHALELVTDPRDKELLVLTAAVVQTAYLSLFQPPPRKQQTRRQQTRIAQPV